MLRLRVEDPEHSGAMTVLMEGTMMIRRGRLRGGWRTAGPIPPLARGHRRAAVKGGYADTSIHPARALRWVNALTGRASSSAASVSVAAAGSPKRIEQRRCPPGVSAVSPAPTDAKRIRTSKRARRVPGLRCEEVAQLDGISSEYYLRLEQDRNLNPSDQTLAAMAGAFQLDEDAVAYPHRLAARSSAGRWRG